MPKYFVVRKWPVSPYHAGSAYSTESAEKARAGCLSIPTASPMSLAPSEIIFAAMSSDEAAVAHPL